MQGVYFYLETAVGKTVTGSRKQEPIADFEANLQAAWQKLERLCQEAQRKNKHAEKEKRWDSERGKVEKAKLSLENSTEEWQKGNSESGLSKRIKERGISGSSPSSQRKRKYSDAEKKSMGFSSISEEDEEKEVFEPPTMSFEEYLTYDQPQKKKKKKVVKASASAGEEDQWHSAHLLCHPSLDSSCASHQSPSRKRTHEKREEQEPPEAPKPKRILLDVDIKLPDIPLLPIQASCSPLPAAESVTCSQKKRRAVYSAAEETEGTFTGRRLHSKTPVYSGPKSARVPKPPSQPSVPVLSNNTDSICEAGGVPVLEPVLERGLPEQLCGTEERHHVLIKETHQLWRNRCLQDFKNEAPKESESWREMYLRLHKAREQRLLTLAQKIGSAQANKGRAAKTLLLDSPPKAPRDVRRRQEKFGTGGALLPEKTKTKPLLCASRESHPRVSEEPSHDGPSTSSGRSVPSLGGTTFSSWAPEPKKPPVKKIAPLMAKSMRDLKKRFSRS
ncbi:elongin-A-like [Numenius arquata]|uniref:elongin-A-like n=1 Tax=Numenius arquata TaxID=31919 RepID=UPI003D306D70